MKKRLLQWGIALSLAGTLVPPVMQDLIVETHAENTKRKGSWQYDSKTGKWWLELSDGSYPAGRWMRVDGKWYYFDDAGYMFTGWLKQGNNRYYLQPDGSMAVNKRIESGVSDSNGVWHPDGWQQTNGKWWYRCSDDTYYKNGWKSLDGVRYYFDEHGWMVTGPLKLKDKEYYLQKDGSRLINGWAEGNYYNEQGLLLPYASTKDDGSLGQTKFSFTKEQAKKLQAKGSLGFFESVGSKDAKQAASMLRNPPEKLADATDLAAKDDATSLDNMKKALDLIDQCNKLRTEEEGLPELKVTHELMAAAQLQSNYSADYAKGHSNVYHVAENLAWGKSNPYKKWFYEQKKNKEENNGKSTSQYDNIIKSYTHTGLAVNQKGDLSSWNKSDKKTGAAAQVFYYREYGMSACQYRKIFMNYYDAIQKALEE